MQRDIGFSDPRSHFGLKSVENFKIFEGGNVEILEQVDERPISIIINAERGEEVPDIDSTQDPIDQAGDGDH